MVLALGCAAATAQAPAPAPAPAPAAKEAQTEDVIVSGKPEQKSRVRQALDRLLGKTESKKLETTGSEVISLPKEKAAELKKRLEKLGAKVTTLRKDWNHILHPAKKDTPLTTKQKAAIETAAKAPETVNVGVLKMPDAAVAELALTKFEQSVGTRGRAGPQDDPYAKVMLPMAGGGHITLVRTRAPDFTPGGVTWVGETEETKERAVLMLWKDGHLSGYFGFKGRVYTVNHVGGDIHTMAEIDPKKLPPDHAPDPKNRNAAVAPPPAPATPPLRPPEPEVAPFADADRQALETKPVVIDVMLLITKKVVDSYIRNPVDLSTLAIEQANNTFRNSGLGNITLRLAHSQVIDYNEADVDQFDSLYAMVDGVGVFKDLKKLRNEKRADIVGMVLDSPKGCGLSTRVGAEADEAFFVVHHACAAITYSIAHEIGHIIGTRHDRYMDTNDKPIPYAHGFINGTKWRDMMSYQEGCNGCPRIPFWSNPRVRYEGEPTGTAASDNARVILEQAERVAKFR
ncbi:MAG: M12 family metallo-peptidase [Hyphomicrobiaceae bacterium]